MLDILSLLDGWKYVFPYFQENKVINTTQYVTIYDTSRTYPTGAIIFASVVMSTPNFHVKISTGETDLHEINVLGLLYGQAPSGFNVPSGIIANAYLPVTETSLNYPIAVADPAVKPATGIILESTDLFPYKDGIELQIKVDNPPQTLYESSIGLVNIYDEKAYLDSLARIYGQVK